MPNAFTATSLDVIPPLAIRKWGLGREGWRKGGRVLGKGARRGESTLMLKALTATSLEVIPPSAMRKWGLEREGRAGGTGVVVISTIPSFFSQPLRPSLLPSLPRLEVLDDLDQGLGDRHAREKPAGAVFLAELGREGRKEGRRKRGRDLRTYLFARRNGACALLSYKLTLESEVIKRWKGRRGEGGREGGRAYLTGGVDDDILALVRL
jgi:hypothetical protein